MEKLSPNRVQLFLRNKDTVSTMEYGWHCNSPVCQQQKFPESHSSAASLLGAFDLYLTRLYKNTILNIRRRRFIDRVNLILE